jgi:WD40 repeat protein
MNIFDIDFNKGFLILAIGNKVGLIPFNRFKTTNIELTGRVKYVLESQYIINHIKLMNGRDEDIYVLAVDDKGILHSKKINQIIKEIVEKEYKTFSCCIDSNDNSTWSLDCNYPFVAVGGNHKCITVNNIEDNSNELISNNIVLYGNHHNVPGICFCENFIACNSIDGKPKIWDLYNGKLVKIIENNTKEWYL